MVSTIVLKFCIFISAVTATYAINQYQKCKDVELVATINKVSITPCVAFPCQLKKGTNITVTVDFTLFKNETAKTATTVVHGVVAGLPVPFRTDYTDACKTANLKCPMAPSSENLYQAKLFIEKEYPDINVYVKWELQDQDKKKIFCFEIPVTIIG